MQTNDTRLYLLKHKTPGFVLGRVLPLFGRAFKHNGTTVDREMKSTVGLCLHAMVFLVGLCLLAVPRVDAMIIGGAFLQGTTLEDGSTSLKVTEHKAVSWSGSTVDPLVFDHAASNPTRLRFKEEGDYFIALTAPLIEGQGINGGIRSSQEFVVFRNGEEVPEGTGSSTYIRHTSGHAESSGHVHFLLTAVESDDYLEVMTRRTTTNMTNDTQMQPTSLYVEKVDASRSVFSGTATQTVAGTNLNGNASPLQWTAGRNDDGFTHDSHEITLEAGGRYMVFANIPLKGPSTRGSVALEVKLDGDRIPGGLAQQGYIRNADGQQEASVHWAGLIVAIEGQKLTVDTLQKAGGGTITVPDGNTASIFIEKFADATDLFAASGTKVVNNSDNWNPGGKSAIQWESADVIDEEVYTHTVASDSHKITIKKAGDYLLTYNDALKDGSARNNPRVTVQVNGEDVVGAESKSHYNRKASGHDESSTSLVFLIEGLSVDDALTVSVQQEGAGGNVNDEVPSLLTLLRRPKLLIPNPIPTIEIAGDLEPPFENVPVALSVTFKVDDVPTAVTGFDEGDVLVTGGELSDFTGSEHTYTFTVTPLDEAGQIEVSIEAGSATDGANESFAGSLTYEYAKPFKTKLTRFEDLVGWWTFDDDSASDSSGNENHGVHSNDSIYNDETPFGKGRSVNLNGNNFITVDDGGNQSTFDGGSAFSISVWVKGWPSGNWNPYVSKRGEGGQGWQIRRRGDSADQITLTLRGPGNDDWPVIRNINDNEWHHLVGTFGGGQRVVYVDGELIGSENRGGNVNPTGSVLVFGARDNSGNANNAPQIGWHSNVWLDDVRFYRISLSADEVVSIYGNGEGDFNEAPVVTLNGDEHMRIEIGAEFVDPGATATDFEEGDLGDVSGEVQGDEDAVNTAMVGDWTLVYTIEDSFGDSATATRTVRVFDPAAPVLTLVGEAEIILEGGTEYVDAGVTIHDSEGNALDPSGIVVTGIPDGNKPLADFIVTFNFEDAEGRAAETATRVVKVVDTTGPVITLDGDAVINHQVGTLYEDLGASAFDVVDGVILVKDSLFMANSLDLKGYMLGGRSDALLDFNDNSGVLSTPPIGLTKWTGEVYMNGDGQFRAAIPQITNNDNYQVVFTGFFEAGLPGDYEFGIENPDDRGAFWIDLDQNDVFETVGSKGPEIMNANWRGGYTTVSLEPGVYNVAIAHQEHGGGSRIDARFKSPPGAGPEHLTRINPSDPNQDGMWGTGFPVDGDNEGTYTITYTAIDQTGNISTATRTVIVAHIIGSPIITLKGDPVVTHEAGLLFEDPGARLRDSKGIPMDHSSIVIEGMPDGSTVGEFKVTYNYTDEEGKSASEVVRIVKVVDTAPPVITLDGDADIIVLEGTEFFDPGATAVDVIDGDSNITVISSNPLISIGLMGGGLNGNMSFEPNPGDIGIDPLGPTLSESTVKPPWRDNYTIVYTGQIYDEDGKVSFTENIDDIAWLSVNGEKILDNAGWNQISTGTFEGESGGWFDFELRMSNGGGGAGKVGAMGFGYDPEGESDFILPRNTNENTADLFRYIEDPASFDTTVLGTHTLTYTASDSSGNKVSVIRTVIVKVDDSLPIITLVGGDEVIHEAGTDFVDPGYTIVDSGGNPLPDATAVVDGTLDINTLGNYTLTYDFTEGGGKEALTVSRTIRVEDNAGPVITLEGDNPMRILVGEEFTEPGVSDVMDVISGDAMATLKIQGQHIIGKEPGLFGEYFDFQQGGTFLFQDPIVRQPNFSRVESKLDFPSSGNAWAGLDNRFRDQFAARYTGIITIEEGGSYTFFTNSDDGSAFLIGDRLLIENGGFHGMVEVAGTIGLEPGDHPISVEFFEGGGGAGLQVSWQGPNIGKQIIPEDVLFIPTYGLDTSNPGVFTVRYTARDALGNIGTVLRTVEVVTDVESPSIVLLGEGETTIEAGAEYTDAGGDIADFNGGLVEGEKAVVDADALDTGKPGSYTVILNYTDGEGREAPPVTRIVHVEDTTAPVLTLNGDAVMKLLVGDTFDAENDLGAKFTDNADGDRDVYYDMPPSAISGLVLHLDADSLSDLYVDGDVMDSGWPDLSVNGNDASNLLGDPTWKTAGLNDMPTVNFDGDDLLWTSKNFEGDLANYTILSVARYTGGDNERVISTKGRNWLFGYHGNNTRRFYADGWIYNQGSADSNWHLHMGDINNKDQANFWVDGIQLATNVNGANNNSYKPRVIQLGGFNDNQEMSKCEVSEVILFDRLLSEREREGLLLHLKAKYAFDFEMKPVVDTSQPGTHEISYQATDSSGNVGTVSRTIVVEEDNDPPVITLAGDAVMYITPGTEFTDPGASAEDRGVEIPVTTSTTFPQDQLLALYSFNDPANPGLDSSSNFQNAVVRGGVTSTAEGRFGAGIELNGSDAYLLTPLDGHHDVDFSWTAWVKTTDGNGGIVSMSQDNWSQGGKGVYVSGGRPKIDVGWVGNGMGTTSLNDGEWHHVTLTVEDSGGNSDPYTIYIDGEVDRSANIDWFRMDGTGHDLRIGHIGIGDGQYLAGTLDDIAIYQRILSQEEIKKMMQGATIIDTNVSAAYPLTYTATDLAGNEASATRLIVVTDDPEIPYIAINGQIEATIELGTDYVDPGAKAYDKAGQFLGDVTAVEVPDGKTLGEFDIAYAFQDDKGKNALPAARTLLVVDTTAPLVTLKESAEFGGTDVVTFKAGQAFEDPGIDIEDGDSNLKTSIKDQLVPEAWFTFDDPIKPGYDKTDNGYDGVFFNNAGRTEKGRYGAGITIPVFDSNARFELLGNGVTIGKEWTATAWFKNLYPTGRWRTLFRGRNSDHQVIVANNSELLGIYANGRGDFRPSGYNLTPADTTEWRHLTAVGKGNETLMYIDGELVGSSDQKGTNTIWRIGNWPGNQHFAKYIDDVMIFDRALSEPEIGIAMRGNRRLDTNNPGTYTISYTVTDSSGNKTTVARTIIVEEDNSAPVITLLGREHVSHEAGIEYVDSGAFVSTADGEPLPTEGFNIETDIDLSRLGTYTYTYNYTDEKGSTAIPVTRTVEIVDTSAPVLTVIGANPMTLPRGEVFDDPGALAEDNLDGVIPVIIGGLSEPWVNLDIGPSGQRAEDGWTAISGGGNNQNNFALQPTEIVTDDGHAFTFEFSNADWRDRGDSIGTDPLTRVAEDFIKNNAGDITLTFMGLPEGEYYITTYHLDTNFTQCAQINIHVTDANGQDVLQGVHGNAGQNPGINGITEGGFRNSSATFPVKSNGLDSVVVRLDGVGADTEVPLNGLVISKPLVISSVGEYTITYTAMDAHGHKVEATRTVIVSDDATIPSITLVGEKEISLEGGTEFEDPGVTLKDRDGNDLDAALVQVSGKVLVGTPGTYVLAYDYSDADGKSAVTRKRVITVTDTIAPAITLDGASTVTHVLGEPYVDAGATATDGVDGDVEVFDTVNFHSPGLIARWSFDEIEDGKVVDLVGGREGTLRGFDVATDHIDGIRGKALNFDGTNNRIDVPPFQRNRKETSIGVWLKRRNGNFSSIFHTKTWTPGDLHYVVQNDILFACNSMGQTSGGGGNDFRSVQQVTANEWVHVVSTYSVPDHWVQIYLDGQLARETAFTGNFSIRYKNGMNIGADSNGTGRFFNGEMDDLVIYDRVLTPHQVQAVMTGTSPVDVQTAGQYTVNYSAYDSSGNKASATRTVIVTADPEIPVITLAGNSEIAHEAGVAFEDPGATVADKDGNALDATKIVVGGEVKADTLGEYVLTYDFTDESGRKAMQIQRKVTVADTLAPEITLNGEKDMRVGLNTEFNDPGATAVDVFDGVVQVQADEPEPIDSTVPGDYEIIYTATDSAGNKTVVKRTVRILPDTTPPVITLVGEATIEVALGGEYDDQGATATDDIDGNLTPFIDDGGSIDSIDTSKAGTYTVTYDVEDFSGNQAIQVKRTVVVKVADPFLDWIASLPDGQQAGDSDPDLDGVPNLLEYALGGDPSSADRALILPTMEIYNGALSLVFVRLKPDIDDKITYLPQLSSGLTRGWDGSGMSYLYAADGVIQAQLPDGKAFASSRYERVRVNVDTPISNAGDKQFLRLTVSRE